MPLGWKEGSGCLERRTPSRSPANASHALPIPSASFSCAGGLRANFVDDERGTVRAALLRDGGFWKRRRLPTTGRPLLHHVLCAERGVFRPSVYAMRDVLLAGARRSDAQLWSERGYHCVDAPSCSDRVPRVGYVSHRVPAAVLAFNDKGAHLYHTLLESLASAAPLLDRVRRGGDLRLLLNACLQKGDRRTTMTPPPPSGRCWPRCRSHRLVREAARLLGLPRTAVLDYVYAQQGVEEPAGGPAYFLGRAVWAAAPASWRGGAADGFAGGGRLNLPNWLLLREELKRSSPHLFSGGGSGGGVRVLYIRREAWQGRQLVARKEARLRRLLAALPNVTVSEWGAADGDRGLAHAASRFGAADAIVAPHGAALTQLLFARPQTAVVEFLFRNESGGAPNMYWTLSAALDLHYWLVLDTHPDSRNHTAPFTDVLPPDVLAALLAALARRGTPVGPPPKGSVGRTLRQEMVEAAEAARTRAAAVCDAPPFGALRPC